MDSNFITAPRREDLAEERQKEDRRICRQYQKCLIDEISNINMGNRDTNLTEVEKIKSCLRDVKLRVEVFEMSTHGIGYRRYCDASEIKRFVNRIFKIVENSDYIRKLNEICTNLKLQYKELRQWINLIYNKEETNFYNYEFT